MADNFNPSREEQILRSIIDNTEYTGEHPSRIENLLLELKEVIESGTKAGENASRVSILNQDKPKFSGTVMTVTWSDINHATVSGTITGTTFCNVAVYQPELPESWSKIYLKYSTTDINIKAKVYFFSGTSILDSAEYTSDTTINVPSGATGMTLRLNVINAKVNGQVYIDVLIDKSTYASTKKYVAFGDSLTWGSVWTATQGELLHQCEEKYRIPTRIAMRTGYENNFDNYAEGGAGYVNPASSGKTIVQRVQEYDFTNVGLITVMGGANDKGGIALGTASSSAGDGTICGAIKSIIDHVKANAKKANLVIIQPTPSGSTSVLNDIWDGVEGGGWSLNDFDEEVSTLCHNNHVMYVNWWDCQYCDNWAQNSGGYHGSSGPNYSHPKDGTDYQILGDFIANKIG